MEADTGLRTTDGPVTGLLQCAESFPAELFVRRIRDVLEQSGVDVVAADAPKPFPLDYDPFASCWLTLQS